MSTSATDMKYWESITPFELSDKDRQSLMTKSDAEWSPHTWADLKAAIDEQDLGSLTRYPTDLRKYILWRREMKTTYPDISQYITTHRLQWTPPHDPSQGFIIHNPVPLANAADYTLRRNDWPYAIEPDVGHVIVWLKQRLDVNELGEPTVDSARLIEEYVQKTFRDVLDASNSRSDAEVIWFKNPVKWQSVRTLEHFHVMTKGVDDRVVERLTGQRADEVIGQAWTSREFEALRYG